MNTGISLYPGLSPKPIDYAALVDDAAPKALRVSSHLFTSPKPTAAACVTK